MTKHRLEAFSDGVFAIILTIMVLELHAPHSSDLAALKPLLPAFCSYALSFAYVAIYWNNHHHMLHSVKHIDGRVLWANMHLLFWLSLTPFVTAWLGGGTLNCGSAAAYGVVLLLSGVAYYILSRSLVRVNGPDSAVAQALGKDVKGRISIVIYAAAIGLAFVATPLSCVLYFLVALMWLVPDRRFEA